MKKERLFIRNFNAGSHLETFLITAVATILVIRAFLKLTGYPKLGGEKLHIAHVLWGGLFMVASILILLVFLGKWRERLAVVVGGVGFGYFIDEVGKFLTHDNNYFFQPSVAVMYGVFILIFITVRSIQTSRHWSRQEYLINAIRELEELAWPDFDREEKDRLLYYLRQCRTDHPLASSLQKTVAGFQAVPAPSLGMMRRWKHILTEHYRRIATSRWFHLGIVILFLVQLLTSLSYVIVLVFFRGLGWDQVLSMEIFNRIAVRVQNLAFIDWAELLSSLLSGVFSALGILLLARRRRLALKMFERSMLISIFLTQLFIFYREEFAALLGLAFNLLILAAIRFMLEKEKAQELYPTRS